MTVKFQTPRGADVALTLTGHTIDIAINGMPATGNSMGGIDVPTLDVGVCIHCTVAGKGSYIQVPAAHVEAVRALKERQIAAFGARGGRTYQPTSFDIEDLDERVLNGGGR